MSYCDYVVRIRPNDPLQPDVCVKRLAGSAQQAVRAALRSAELSGGARVSADGGGIFTTFLWTDDQRLVEQAHYSVK